MVTVKFECRSEWNSLSFSEINRQIQTKGYYEWHAQGEYETNQELKLINITQKREVEACVIYVHSIFRVNRCAPEDCSLGYSSSAV